MTLAELIRAAAKPTSNDDIVSDARRDACERAAALAEQHPGVDLHALPLSFSDRNSVELRLVMYAEAGAE